MIWSRRDVLRGVYAGGVGRTLGGNALSRSDTASRSAGQASGRRANASCDGIRAVHFAEVDPGGEFVKDPDAAVDVDSGTPLDRERILTPNVVHRRPSGYRMYYT